MFFRSHARQYSIVFRLYNSKLLADRRKYSTEIEGSAGIKKKEAAARTETSFSIRAGDPLPPMSRLPDSHPPRQPPIEEQEQRYSRHQPQCHGVYRQFTIPLGDLPEHEAGHR